MAKQKFADLPPAQQRAIVNSAGILPISYFAFGRRQPPS